MTAKQLKGKFTPDQGEYICSTDGNGNLVPVTTVASGNVKLIKGAYSPDGSYYATLVDGNGNLT